MSRDEPSWAELLVWFGLADSHVFNYFHIDLGVHSFVTLPFNHLTPQLIDANFDSNLCLIPAQNMRPV